MHSSAPQPSTAAPQTTQPAATQNHGQTQTQQNQQPSTVSKVVATAKAAVKAAENAQAAVQNWVANHPDIAAVVMVLAVLGDDPAAPEPGESASGGEEAGGGPGASKDRGTIQGRQDQLEGAQQAQADSAKKGGYRIDTGKSAQDLDHALDETKGKSLDDIQKEQ